MEPPSGTGSGEPIALQASLHRPGFLEALRYWVLLGWILVPWFEWLLLGDVSWPVMALGGALALLAYVALARWRWPVWIVVPVAGVLGLLGQGVVG